MLPEQEEERPDEPRPYWTEGQTDAGVGALSTVPVRTWVLLRLNSECTLAQKI